MDQQTCLLWKLIGIPFLGWIWTNLRRLSRLQNANLQFYSHIEFSKTKTWLCQMVSVSREMEQYRIQRHVKEAWPAFPFITGSSPEKIFLGMASNLGWSPGGHKFFCDPSPIPFSQLLQSSQKSPMLFLRPWHP